MLMDWERLPTIQTNRLSLRWISAEDVDDFYAIYSNPEVMRYWSTPSLPDRNAASRLVSEIHEGFKRRELLKWGNGYMHETLKALLTYAFDVLDFHRIEADVDPRNAASIRTLERLGFQREGYLRERWQVNGEIQDALFYGLLRPDWNNLNTNK